MKSDVIVSLIKEIVKNEVKQQVKEEIVKLIKSGAVTLNKERKEPSLMEMTEVTSTAQTKKQTVVPTQKKQVKEFTKDPLLNEILSQTTPFTAAHRVEGGTASTGGSILDSIQPNVNMEGDWETMDYRTKNIPTQQINETGDMGIDAITKALTRDYRELVKRF
jgi:hypothetical protein